MKEIVLDVESPKHCNPHVYLQQITPVINYTNLDTEGVLDIT